jgi:hypothetical protein
MWSSWENLRISGIGYWCSSITSLKSAIETLAKKILQSQLVQKRQENDLFADREGTTSGTADSRADTTPDNEDNSTQTANRGKTVYFDTTGSGRASASGSGSGSSANKTAANPEAVALWYTKKA